MQRVTSLAPSAATQASVLTAELKGVKARETAKLARKSPRRWQPITEKVEVDVVTLSEDDVRDGYELRFPPREKGEIPQYAALVTLLNQNGWGFSKIKDGRFDPRWYHKRNPESLKFAKSIVQMFKGDCEVA